MHFEIISNNNMSATVYGVIAALIIFVSFALRGEKKIRLVNLVGCVFLVLYGATMEKPNIILLLLGAATAVMHCVQFWAMWKEAKSAKAVAKAEARAAEVESRSNAEENKEM